MQGSDFVAELQRRVTQLDPVTALAAINRALAWISRQGSFSFQLTGNTGPVMPDTPVSDSLTVPPDCDVGKAMFVANSPSGLVIHKKGISDFWESAFRNVPSGMGYDVYTVRGNTLAFRPSGAGGLVNIQYHVLFSPIGLGDTPTIPNEFDPLVVDLAEAEEKRIYDVGTDWQAVFARCQDQIKVMLDGYRSVSMEEMTETDAQIAAAEKSQLGRP